MGEKGKTREMNRHFAASVPYKGRWRNYVKKKVWGTGGNPNLPTFSTTKHLPEERGRLDGTMKRSGEPTSLSIRWERGDLFDEPKGSKQSTFYNCMEKVDKNGGWRIPGSQKCTSVELGQRGGGLGKKLEKKEKRKGQKRNIQLTSRNYRWKRTLIDIGPRRMSLRGGGGGGLGKRNPITSRKSKRRRRSNGRGGGEGTNEKSPKRMSLGIEIRGGEPPLIAKGALMGEWASGRSQRRKEEEGERGWAAMGEDTVGEGRKDSFIVSEATALI